MSLPTRFGGELNTDHTILIKIAKFSPLLFVHLVGHGCVTIRYCDKLLL